MLDSSDNMRRCAAAITLAELAPRDVDVVEALGGAIDHANQTLIVYLLEALDRIGSPAAVPFVLPLLDSEDMATKLRAAGIIAKGGARVVPGIKARLETAPPREKLVLVDLLARIHTRDAFEAILQQLMDPSFDLVKETCEAVHRHIEDVTSKTRTTLHTQVVEFMQRPKVKARERLLASCLLLLGTIGKPDAKTVLLKYTDAKMSPYLRRHALLGLRNVTLSGAASEAVSKKLMPYLDEDDEDIVRLALDVVRRLYQSGLSVTQARKLLKGRQGAVRAFAVRRLAESDAVPNIRELMGLLNHEDSQVVEIAASALARNKKATALLLDAFAKEPEEDASWRLARILKPHAESVSRERVKTIAELAEQDFKTGKPRAKALLYFLRNTDPGAADAVVLETGLKHWRAKRWNEAVDCLRHLIHADCFDNKAGYALSVCDLKRSTKDLSPNARAEYHALRGFRVLLRDKAFKLLDRLRKDKSLDASDLFYVGFHFAETPGEEGEFGEQLLAHVAKTWPQSEDGKAAKSRLRLMGKGASGKSRSKKT